MPITQTILPDQDIRYAVPVQIGNAPPIEALLDTGSTGLRVLKAALPPAGFTDTGFASLYAYGAGDRLAGTVGMAAIGIGGAATADAVPFESSIRSAAWISRRAAGPPPCRYGITASAATASRTRVSWPF